jgi:hypothetical protein
VIEIGISSGVDTDCAFATGAPLAALIVKLAVAVAVLKSLAPAVVPLSRTV